MFPGENSPSKDSRIEPLNPLTPSLSPEGERVAKGRVRGPSKRFKVHGQGK